MELNKFCDTYVDLENCQKSVPPRQCTLLELSNDLKYMFENKVQTDFVIYVGNKAIPCHRAILKARSKWFSLRIDQENLKKKNSIKMEENNLAIVDAILLYIYTGNLRLIESLRVPFLDLYEAADRYGLGRLRNVLTSMIKSSQLSMTSKTIQFNCQFCISLFSEFTCPSLNDFSVDGTDKWWLQLKPAVFSHHRFFIGIYLIRNTKKSETKKVHITHLQLQIIDSLGVPRRTFVSSHIFKSDGEYKMPESISLNKLLESPFEMAPNNMLSLSVLLTVSVDDLESSCRTVFELGGSDLKYASNELHALSYDMYTVMKDENYCDTVLHVKQSAFRKVHSSILHARSRIPITQFPKLEDMFGFGQIVWRAFIAFMYTGQVRYLDDHAILLYRSASEFGLSEARAKYANILAGNLQLDNVAVILYEATTRKDSDLQNMTLSYILNNCREFISHPSWKQFSWEFPSLSAYLLRTCQIKVAK